MCVGTVGTVGTQLEQLEQLEQTKPTQWRFGLTTFKKYTKITILFLKINFYQCV